MKLQGSITVPDVFNDAALRGKFPVKRVVANAGDLVIWHSLSWPRMAQYITMFKPSAHSTFKANNDDVEEERRRRIKIWEGGLNPSPTVRIRGKPSRDSPDYTDQFLKPRLLLLLAYGHHFP